MATLLCKCPTRRRCSGLQRYGVNPQTFVRWESGSRHASTPAPVPFPARARGWTSSDFIQRRDVAAPHNGIIRVLTLHSPENRNALSRQMVADLARETTTCMSHNVRAAEHLLQARAMSAEPKFGVDDRGDLAGYEGEGAAGSKEAAGLVRAVVIASGIDKVFCAGADLKERGKMSEGETLLFLSHLRQTFDDVSSSSVPVIAAVSGFALGGGLELALAASFRVFGSRAVVGLPETRLGIVPGAGGLYRLRDLIGTARAADMILTGRRVNADEAQQMGICQRLVQMSDSTAEAEGRELVTNAAIDVAKDIAMGAPKATAAAVNFFRVGSRDSDREEEKKAYDSVLRTSDRLEALEAFREKRKAVFKGF